MNSSRSTKLASISLREIEIPLIEPFNSAGGTVDRRRVLLVEMIDVDGLTAWSECVAEAFPAYSPDTVDTAWLALTEYIIPLVLKQVSGDARSINTLFDNRIRGHAMPRAAVEMGFWALEAIRSGKSLAATLVRASNSATPNQTPRSTVTTGIALGMMTSPDALADRAAVAVAEGYQRIKLKVVPGRDVSFARAVRHRIGDEVQLTVDANCSYSLTNAANRQSLNELDQLGLRMIEQPLAHDDLVNHAALQRRLVTPICLDESIQGVASAEAMVLLGSARVVNIKPGRVGGLQQALAIHDVCVRAEVAAWCGGMLETGIGRAYNVALASLPGFTEPGDLSPSARYYERDIIVEPWTMDAHGSVRVPLEQAGLSIDVDVDYIDELTARRTTFRAPGAG
ncbi:MAG: o-succinylbenzoate synthase [Gemmatimonadaceae bacterium]